jgi:REP element-mobilizing transposase RayT
MEPIYSSKNTSPAYQLNWSVSLFGRAGFPPSELWLDQLRTTCEDDAVRILEFRAVEKHVVQFLVSTQPYLSPSQTVRSLKGRWQYLIRERAPKAFRRNYSICSVGEANCRVLEQYVAGQTSQHRMADPNVQRRIESFQFHDREIDLGRTMTGTYGQFVHALQVVVENERGWHEIREDALENSRSMVIRTARKKHWRLSRIGILSNHIHILLGADVTESPAEIALSLMNNLAYAQGMKPVLRFSYYVGTFGRYDRGAVRRAVAASR